MTYHFVNLVSISWFFGKELNSSTLFCDGFTLALLSRIKGVRLNQISGPSIVDSVKDLPKLTILGGPGFDINCLELPFWDDLGEVRVTKEISEHIEGYDNIIVAISSPKQDKLALQINAQFPNKHIYCLGAAVQMKDEIKYLEKYNLMWLGFLINQPKRTIIKMSISIQRFFSLLILRKNNKELRTLLKSFSNDITCIKRA